MEVRPYLVADEHLARKVGVQGCAQVLDDLDEEVVVDHAVAGDDVGNEAD
jgi:hypothetical protein